MSSLSYSFSIVYHLLSIIYAIYYLSIISLSSTYILCNQFISIYTSIIYQPSMYLLPIFIYSSSYQSSIFVYISYQLLSNTICVSIIYQLYILSTVCPYRSNLMFVGFCIVFFYLLFQVASANIISFWDML